MTHEHVRQEESVICCSRQTIVQHDIRGQICPSCLITTLKEINVLQGKLQAGTVCLRVLTDSRDATATIPAAVENMGYRVTVQKEQDFYVIAIGK